MTKTAPGPLLNTLTTTWKQIQTDHPELPTIQIAITTGPATANHEAQRWDTDGDTHPLIAIPLEVLRAGHTEVLRFLLHEAAHLLCWRRGIKDTTTRGAYHNTRYLAAAVEVGLEWPPGTPRVERRGYTDPRLTTATREKYENPLGDLAEVLPRVMPHIDVPDPYRSRTPRRVILVCQCEEPRRLQIAAGVAGRGPIICGLCRSDFTPSPASDTA
ncbi:hypothetical protein [Streptomyces sp. NPDC088115]|uniref:hypothetical protein n=1 Tax=Streptomyces sp. NPDC088115 TaxID=3365824 RepID=UPI00382AE7C0